MFQNRSKASNRNAFKKFVQTIYQERLLSGDAELQYMKDHSKLKIRSWKKTPSHSIVINNPKVKINLISNDLAFGQIRHDQTKGLKVNQYQNNNNARSCSNIKISPINVKYSLT